MSIELPPEQRASYAGIIDEILQNADLEQISAKAIRQGMQQRVQYDLTPQKSAITALIMERFDKIQCEREDSTQSPVKAPDSTTNGFHEHDAKKRKTQNGDQSELDDSPPPKKVKTEKLAMKKEKKAKTEAESDGALAARLQAEENAQARSTRGGGVTRKKVVVKKSKKKSAARIGSDDDGEMNGATSEDTKERTGGFHKLMTLSTPLAALLGETALSRPQTVKKIWAYVKERDLQDPGDKRQIRCDDAMHAVFKQDRVHMFTMNKILATHLYPVEE